MKQKLN